MGKRWQFERQNISFWEAKHKLLTSKRQTFDRQKTVIGFLHTRKKYYVAYYQEVIKFAILRVICGGKVFGGK